MDVGHKVNFARNVGATVEVDHTNEMVAVNATNLTAGVLTRDEYDLPIRTTYLLAAAQLLREGIARIPYPGGCPIGGGTS
ncbi:UDP-N-acetylglucosamine 1-carboxyvinyltransferase, partial [Microbacterium sp. SUBG005]